MSIIGNYCAELSFIIMKKKGRVDQPYDPKSPPDLMFYSLLLDLATKVSYRARFVLYEVQIVVRCIEDFIQCFLICPVEAFGRRTSMESKFDVSLRHNIADGGKACSVC